MKNKGYQLTHMGLATLSSKKKFCGGIPISYFRRTSGKPLLGLLTASGTFDFAA